MKQFTFTVFALLLCLLSKGAKAQVKDTVYIGQLARYTVAWPQEGVRYVWSVSGGELITQNPSSEAQIRWGEQTGIYDLVMVQTSKTSCQTDTSRFKVLVTEDSNPPDVHLPNVFTPNGDGQNDFFVLTAEHFTELHLSIFNRWGTMVFESSSITDQWDGKYHHEICPAGAYYYLLKAKNRSLEKTIKGFVQIER